MPTNQYLFDFSDGGSLDRLSNRLRGFQTRIDALRQSLLRRGQGTSNLEEIATGFNEQIRQSSQRVNQLFSQIQQLNKAIAEAPPVGGIRDPQTGRFAGREAIIGRRDEAQRALAAEQIRLQDALLQGEEQLIGAFRRDLGVQESINTVVRQRDALIRRLSELTGGGQSGALQEVAEKRRNALLQRQRELIKAIADERIRIEQQTPRNLGEANFKKIEQSEKRVLDLVARRTALLEQERIIRQQIAEQDLQQRGGGTPSEGEQQALDQARAAAKKRLLEINNQISNAERSIAVEQERQAEALRIIEQLESSGGATAGTAELQRRLLAVNEQLAALDTSEVQELSRVAGVDLNQAFDQLLARARQLAAADLAPEEEAAQFRQLRQEAQQLFQTLEGLDQRQIPQLLDPQDQFQGLRLFERTVLGAFEGIGQRFRATLQFALSGALLFQAQRLAREFVQAAIEVERSFEDIRTAFEFDIVEQNPDAIRGTFAFDQQIEGIRRRLVDLSDELQALPSEVNEVAYEMVARFSNVDAALIATRAQVLAAKVATIDQAEALQSLTAVAESYAQQLDRNLTAEERQIATARLYARALDGAVAIQQEFGITVEETIEGTAGLAEIFAAEGFSLAQTQAALALVIQRTGSTGASAADSIGRAIGQLTSPEVKGEVLALADAFDQFTLTTRDFSNGEEALRRINEEIDRLREFDPATANQIQNRLQQIIGQRRETRFVAPLLGSSDLQAEAVGVVEAGAGEAERRFSFLARTTEELIQSIIGQFQELAQNLTQLGFLTPLRALLTLLDQILNAVNEFLKQVQNVFNLLNAIRFSDIGLGDLASNLLTGVIAATAFKRSIDVLRTSLLTLGGSKLAGFFAGLTGATQGVVGAATVTTGASGVAGAAGAASLLGIKRTTDALQSADDQLLRFGTAIRAFFLDPIGTMQFVVASLYSSISKLIAVLTTQVASTRAVTTAEAALAALRASSSFSVAVSTFGRGLLSLLGILGRGIAVGARFVGALSLILTAIESVRALFAIIGEIPDIVTGVGTDIEQEVEGRVEELEQAPGAQNQTDRQRRIQALQDLEDTLSEEREAANSLGGTIAEFVFTMFGLADNTRLALPGIALADATRRLELTDLQLQEFASRLALLQDIRPSLSPEQQANLDTALSQFADIAVRFEAARQQGQLDPETAIGRTNLFNFDEELQTFAEFLTTEIGAAAEGGVEGYINTVKDNLKRIQEELQFGDLTFDDALGQLAEQLAVSTALVEQAESPEERASAEQAVRDSRAAIVQVLDQNVQFDQRLAALYTRNEIEQAAANLSAARDALETATEIFDANSNIIRDRRIAVAEAERNYTEVVNREAQARLQLEVDQAKAFQEQIKALFALRGAIVKEIIAKEGIIDFYSSNISAEDQQRIIDVDNQIADIRLRRAELTARLAILEQASTQDSIAAARAELAALITELEFMRSQGEEDLLIREQIQEIRQAQADLLLALADRRASYFDLTAGVGDQIASAQARLRAANDRLSTLTDLGAEETQEGYEAQLEVLRAQENLAQIALTYADLQRRLASDLTDDLEQAFLDVQQAQQALAGATGPIEQLEAQRQLAEAEASAQQTFYDRRISDLDFLFETEQIGQRQYISALRQLQSGIDRTTRQGEELWRDIELQIRGLEDQAQDLQFNIPTNIQLPTLFEVRRALSADALGVNYQDNRQQDIQLFVTNEIDLATTLAALEDAFGQNVNIESSRLATGGASLTIGGLA